jgi:TPR repeat protein
MHSSLDTTLPFSAGLIQELYRGPIGMNRTFNAPVAALMLAASFAGPVAGGPFDDADAAYQKGDYATALRLLRPLAERGEPEAQVKLGFMYGLGQGVPRDHRAQVMWLRKAAEQGLDEAQFKLGLLYYLGIGQDVPQDYAAAASWFRKSAEHGDPAGQHMLATMYYNGLGVPQDYVIAHMWLNLVAVGMNGDKDAVKARDMVAAKMTPGQIAEAQKLAREWKPTSTPAQR